MSTITKLEAANRQLCTAIRMFFAGDDAVAVHTLACAAREIYEKHCRKSGHGRMFDFVQAGNPGYAERDLWNLLNGARNFFKHEGGALDDRIEFDDTMNDFALLTACTDCATLCSPNQPSEVQAFTIWYLAVEEPDEQAMSEADPAEADQAREIHRQVDQLYPGLRSADRDEKKRFGRRLMQDALEGLLVKRSDAQPSDILIADGVALTSNGSTTS